MKFHYTSDIFCSIYGHNYFKLANPSEHDPKLVCKCCKKQFIYDENGEIIEFKENILGNLSFI